VELAAMVGRDAVGAILVVAGLMKVRAGQRLFIETVLGYALLPSRVAAGAARIVPWSEIGLGLCLLLALAVPTAVMASIALLLLFTSAITANLLRGRRNACGCFASRTAEIGWRMVARNSVLIALLLLSALDPGAGPELLAL
jgi:uncharacterized membrane protein YphA (DoxX/SURF4 family)